MIKRTLSMITMAMVAACAIGAAATPPPPPPPPQPPGEDGVRVIGVCAAVQTQGASPKSIRLRGIGRVGGDGFVMFDHTCPMIETFAPPIVAVILLDIPTGYTALRELVNSHVTGLHNLLIDGMITCVNPLRPDRNRISGNGFGSYGRIACRMAVAKVHRLEAWW